MRSLLGWLFLVEVIAASLVPFLMHLILIRLFNYGRLPAMRQKGAVISGVLGLAPVVILYFIWIYFILPRDNPFPILDGIYLFGVYLLATYIYFHIFNMSETARRIHILTEQNEEQVVSKNEIINNYTGGHLLEVRLRRLLALGELRQIENKYVIGRGLLVWAAWVVFRFRQLLFPAPKDTGRE